MARQQPFCHTPIHVFFGSLLSANRNGIYYRVVPGIDFGEPSESFIVFSCNIEVTHLLKLVNYRY